MPTPVSALGMPVWNTNTARVTRTPELWGTKTHGSFRILKRERERESNLLAITNDMMPAIKEIVQNARMLRRRPLTMQHNAALLGRHKLENCSFLRSSGPQVR